MTTKFRMKIGALEVDYEGSEEFLEDKLAPLIATMSELRHESETHARSNSTADHFERSESGSETPRAAVTRIEGTTSTLAARLKANSGPELILAACARLSLGLNERSFRRKQIIAEMRTASGYFKNTYVDNMTTYLRRLIRIGALVEPSHGMYALSAAKREELEKRLG